MQTSRLAVISFKNNYILKFSCKNFSLCEIYYNCNIPIITYYTMKLFLKNKFISKAY